MVFWFLPTSKALWRRLLGRMIWWNFSQLKQRLGRVHRSDLYLSLSNDLSKRSDVDGTPKPWSISWCWTDLVYGWCFLKHLCSIDRATRYALEFALIERALDEILVLYPPLYEGVWCLGHRLIFGRVLPWDNYVSFQATWSTTLSVECGHPEEPGAGYHVHRRCDSEVKSKPI